MRVSILVSDMSDNCLGRAYLLGKILLRDHEVEILGPIFGKAVWAPCDTGEFDYKVVRARKLPGFLLTQRKLMGMVTGDVIYASKNRPTSFGTALKIRRKRGTPVILDIDDCEGEIKAVVDAKRDLREEYVRRRRRREAELAAATNWLDRGSLRSSIPMAQVMSPISPARLRLRFCMDRFRSSCSAWLRTPARRFARPCPRSSWLF